MSGQPSGPTIEPLRPHPSESGNQTSSSTEHVYQGRRDLKASAGEECTVTVDGEPLDCRYDLLSASPAGFEWNYGGSGPAQLAIALLAHAFGDEFAHQHYQRLKQEIVAELPEGGWTLTTGDLNAWLEGVRDDA